MTTSGVRERIIETASALFYERGVHVVGVDEIVERSNVAKSSMYRHFRSKDELVAAYVQAEDEAFWRRWDEIVQAADDPASSLRAVVTWIGEKIERTDYRGCPQLNVAAEFPDVEHPARAVATNHKRELRRRLAVLVGELGIAEPDAVTDALWLMIDGAFADHDQLRSTGDAVDVLRRAVDALLGSRAHRTLR